MKKRKIEKKITLNQINILEKSSLLKPEKEYKENQNILEKIFNIRVTKKKLNF